MNTNYKSRRLSLMFGIAAMLAASMASAQNTDDYSPRDVSTDRDVYMAQETVDIDSAINGDLVAAGQRITLGATVSGDVIAAGQSIEINSRVNDDVRAAAQHVRVLAPVEGHLVAAGQTVTVSNDVNGWAWLAGYAVDVDGDIAGDLSVRASRVSLNSRVDGNVELSGDELQIGPQADVRGDLIWRSNEAPDISPEARIAGEIIEEPLQGLGEEVRSGRALAFTLSVIVAVATLFLLFTRPMRASADRIAARPGMSLSLGFAVMVALPVLALVLLFSPLSAWVGLGLVCIYIVILLVGMLTGLFAVGDLLLRRIHPEPRAWQALTTIVVTVVAIGLLSFVPYLGALTIFVIWLLGVGGLCARGWSALRHRRLTQESTTPVVAN
ncbi:MAG: hypothetical protein AAF270_08230 [Pseudomonadota bacterium]